MPLYDINNNPTLNRQKKKSNGCLYLIIGFVAIVFIIIYTYKDERNTVKDGINVPAYTTKGTLGKIEEQNTPTATRRAVDLEVPKYLTDSDIDAEIRSAINIVYQKFPNVNAIMVRVFEVNNNVSIATGVYAPYGRWAVSEFPDRKDYQVKISIHRDAIDAEKQINEFMDIVPRQ